MNNKKSIATIIISCAALIAIGAVVQTAPMWFGYDYGKHLPTAEVNTVNPAWETQAEKQANDPWFNEVTK